MDLYYPPEGFTLDEASGMYYQWFVAPKEDGTEGNFIVWFDGQTGNFTEPQEYIAPVAVAEVAPESEVAAEPEADLPVYVETPINPDTSVYEQPAEVIPENTPEADLPVYVENPINPDTSVYEQPAETAPVYEQPAYEMPAFTDPAPEAAPAFDAQQPTYDAPPPPPVFDAPPPSPPVFDAQQPMYDAPPPPPPIYDPQQGFDPQQGYTAQQPTYDAPPPSPPVFDAQQPMYDAPPPPPPIYDPQQGFDPQQNYTASPYEQAAAPEAAAAPEGGGKKGRKTKQPKAAKPKKEPKVPKAPKERKPKSAKSKKEGVAVFIFLLLVVGIGGGALYLNGMLPFGGDGLATFSTQSEAEATPTATLAPTAEPTEEVAEPTEEPTEEPTAEPTEEPTEAVSEEVMSGDTLTESMYGIEIYEMLGDTVTDMTDVVRYMWNLVEYREGEVGGVFTEWPELICAEQDTGAIVLKLSMGTNTVTYEGVVWKGGDGYDVSLHVSEAYWFSCAIDVSGNGTITYTQLYNSFDSAYASVELSDEYGSYSLGNALDQDPSTAWSIGSSTSESATFEYGAEKEIYGVAVLNGYWKSESTYYNNARATYLSVLVGDTYIGGEPMDAYGYNEAVAAGGGYNVLYLFEEPVTAKELTLMFPEAVSGDKYNDICFSEILILTN